MRNQRLVPSLSLFTLYPPPLSFYDFMNKLWQSTNTRTMCGPPWISLLPVSCWLLYFPRKALLLYLALASPLSFCSSSAASVAPCLCTPLKWMFLEGHSKFSTVSHHGFPSTWFPFLMLSQVITHNRKEWWWSWTHCGDHFTTYTYSKSLCCTPENNKLLKVSILWPNAITDETLNKNLWTRKSYPPMLLGNMNSSP